MSKLRNSLNLLSKLTGRRLRNGLKITVSFYLSRLLHKPVHWGMPVSISVEPTNRCNLTCSECPSGQKSFSRHTGMLSEELFKKIIDELHKDLLYLNLCFQGEPYLNPYFFDFVRYAAQKKIYTTTSTNAHFLDDEHAKETVTSGLDCLIISMDGMEQETYSLYRTGGDIEKVKDGIRNMVKWKKELKSATPYIVLQFLVLKHNEHQLEEIKRFGAEAGVDKVELKTAQIYDFQHNGSLIPSIDKYARYKRSINGEYVIKSKLPDYCFRMWSSCVVTWDGLVVPCCFDKDANYPLGDLKQKPFKEISISDKYHQFRKSVLTNRKGTAICCNCIENL